MEMSFYLVEWSQTNREENDVSRGNGGAHAPGTDGRRH
jgi:hypothetical protein